MEKSYFKDILNELSLKHPNSKIFLISDEHFYHSNILKYSRLEFSSLEEMHKRIISSHNEIVGPNDIVIFLGDFSFKPQKIKGLLTKLNGFKYLLLGNHDDERIVKKYREYGFDGIYTYPIKIDDAYLSHEPLDSEERTDVHFKILSKEFSKSNGINYHGHIHEKESLKPRFINVTCESLDYKPLYLRTTGKVAKGKQLLISSEYFYDFLESIKNHQQINEELLIKDYIYSLMLEALTPYLEQYVVYGSFPLYKRYGFASSFSDLDIGIRYDESQSKKANLATIKSIADSVYQALNIYPNLELSYHKRITNMCIWKAMFEDGHKSVKTYYDSNLVLEDVYKPTDLVLDEHTTEFEKILQNGYRSILSSYYFPHYKAQFLTTQANIANITLQILFQKDNPNKRASAIKKLKFVSSNPKEPYDDINSLDNVFIRFLIRNISLLETVRRNNEIEIIQDGFGDISDFLKTLPTLLREELEEILLNPNSEFNRNFNVLKEASINELPYINKELIKELKK